MTRMARMVTCKDEQRTHGQEVETLCWLWRAVRRTNRPERAATCQPRASNCEFYERLRRPGYRIAMKSRSPERAQQLAVGLVVEQHGAEQRAVECLIRSRRGWTEPADSVPRAQRLPLVLVLLFAVLAGCGGTDGQPPAQRRRPKNLLVISIDTVRADHLSCYGYERETSPRIDAYARRGVRFVNCISPSSWTVPAHLSIFTGLEPSTHQCVYYKRPGRLNAGYETMAKIFTRNGYRTGAFTGGGFAGARHGMDIGFEHFETRGRRFEQNLKPALSWLEGVGQEPFFLFFHGFNAHRPYMPPPKYRDRFRGDYQGSYPIQKFAPSQPEPSPEDLEFVISQYDGEIAFVDDLLAFLFKQLEQRGLMERTLVVILSDHGEEFYEHGSCDHIRTLYDELVRVPWIMFGPSIPAREVHNQVGTLDVLPTLLSIFGLESDAPMQGTDRSALIWEGSGTKDSPICSFTGKGLPPYHLSSIQTRKWKLITNLPAGCPNKKCPYCRRGEEEPKLIELYDLQADPGEQRNLADAQRQVVTRLYAQLEQRIAASKPLRRGVAEPEAAPDQEYLRTLRSLGYIGDRPEPRGDKEKQPDGQDQGKQPPE
jgi:arylsulfatase A-like enzyme